MDGSVESSEQRIEKALAELTAQGIPATPRQVPGRYRLGLLARFFGRVGTDVLVDVESAYPIGVCTWSQPGPHGTDRYEELLTGITASRRIVPMTEATAGDAVEPLYARWRQGPDNSAGLAAGSRLGPEKVALALERLLSDSR